MTWRSDEQNAPEKQGSSVGPLLFLGALVFIVAGWIATGVALLLGADPEVLDLLIR